MSSGSYDVERVLAIDPATKNLGWAVFEVDYENCVGRLLGHGGSRGRDARWERNVDSQVMACWAQACEWEVGRCLIECPEAFSSERSQGAMGSVLKLALFVGSLRQAMLEGGLEVELIPVRAWKGTVPKRITMKRIRTHWGWKGTDHNIGDAVGIGDWYVRKVLEFEAVKTDATL